MEKICRPAIGSFYFYFRCSDNLNSRLAIAKDHIRLTNLADEIRHVEDEESEDYYWIGKKFKLGLLYYGDICI